MTENTLNDFHDFLEVLLDYQKKEKHPELWYRGQKDASWRLIPGAFRDDRWQFSEREVLLRFKLHAPALLQDCPDLEDYRRWLPLMQHYGVPTRLLDWSISPLIALFFAVNHHPADTDAAIFMLNPWKWNSIHYQNSRLIPIESISDKTRLCIIGNAFHSIKGGNPPFPVYSASSFQRSFMQQSTFTVHDSNAPMESYDDNDCITKFIIPKEQIEEFKNVLKAFQINEFALYSDLDSLGRWIKHLKPDY